MEIGFSEVIKFCTRKLIKRIHFMSSLKMINLFQDMMSNFPPKMWVLRSQDLQLLWLIGHSSSTRITNFWIRKYCKYQISTVYQENIVWTSLFLLGRGGRWIFYQIFEKKRGRGGRLDMITIIRWWLLGKMWLRFFMMGVAGAGAFFYIKIN